MAPQVQQSVTAAPQSRAAAADIGKHPAAGIVDNRPETVMQRRVQQMAAASGVIQRVGEQFQKAAGATVGARYEQQFTRKNIFDPSVNEVFNVHTSEQKHWLESYRTQEVTTAAAPVNTIATVNRAQFVAAFDHWVDHVIDYVEANGIKPHNGEQSAGGTPDFATDATGGGVHSFPIAGAGAVSLTAAQFNALKLFARHYYGFGARTKGSYTTEFNKVNNGDADVANACALLGISRRSAGRQMEREIRARDVENMMLGHTFMGQ